MATEREKVRLYWSIFVLYGIYHMLDQWTRFLTPFLQSTRISSNFMREILLLNAAGNCATFMGSFLIAHVIDSVGCKTSAMFVTFVTGIYQVIIPSAPSYSVFMVMQILLFANQMPMVVEALIAHLVGMDGDDKERARLITRLTVPQTFATLTPALAAQTLYFLSLNGCQQLCGLLHLSLLFVIPFLIKEDYNLSKISSVPSLSAYMDLLADRNVRWSLIFLLLIAAPYSAYDQVLRTTLTFRMMARPSHLALLVAVIGISGVLTTLLILPQLQSRVGPQSIVQISLCILTLSYIYLSQVTENMHLLLGMQAQMIGVCLAFGQLASQILGHAGRGQVGKAAAMSRASLVGAAAIAPFIVGYTPPTITQDHSPLCYVCAFISLLAIPVVHFFGKFMHSHFVFLPRAHKA